MILIFYAKSITIKITKKKKNMEINNELTYENNITKIPKYLKHPNMCVYKIM
jgi:hypothetical protein